MTGAKRQKTMDELDREFDRLMRIAVVLIVIQGLLVVAQVVLAFLHFGLGWL